MSKKIATLAMAAVLSTATLIPPAEAGRDRGHHYRGHHAYNHHNRHHRGRGYWKNGKWIALGILGAAAAAAIANSDRDCYYRHGRRYCDY